LIYTRTIQTYIKDALQTKGTDKTKVRYSTLLGNNTLHTSLTNSLSLDRTATNTGLLYMLFIVLEGLWLSATFIIPEACSVLPAGHCMVLHLLAATRLVSTNRKASVTTAVLSNTGVLGKILLRQHVPRKMLTNRNYSPALSAIFMQ
jgi:hypothetical protein